MPRKLLAGRRSHKIGRLLTPTSSQVEESSQAAESALSQEQRGSGFEEDDMGFVFKRQESQGHEEAQKQLRRSAVPGSAVPGPAVPVSSVPAAARSTLGSMQSGTQRAPVKRRRGRPRTRPLPAEPPIKRRRGRPRIHPVKTGPKRRPGRPRKNPLPTPKESAHAVSQRRMQKQKGSLIDMLDYVEDDDDLEDEEGPFSLEVPKRPRAVRIVDTEPVPVKRVEPVRAARAVSGTRPRQTSKLTGLRRVIQRLDNEPRAAVSAVVPTREAVEKPHELPIEPIEPIEPIDDIPDYDFDFGPVSEPVPVPEPVPEAGPEPEVVAAAAAAAVAEPESVEVTQIPLKASVEELPDTSFSRSRRLSLSNRGKRLSSVGNGFSAEPHPDVPIEQFYEHFDETMPDPRKMRQLLVWCCKRIEFGQSRKDQRPVDIAVGIKKQLTHDVANGKIDVGWWEKNGKRQAAAARGPIMMKPNEANVRNALSLEEFERKLDRLKSEEVEWSKVMTAGLPSSIETVYESKGVPANAVLDSALKSLESHDQSKDLDQKQLQLRLADLVEGLKENVHRLKQSAVAVDTLTERENGEVTTAVLASVQEDDPLELLKLLGRQLSRL